MGQNARLLHCHRNHSLHSVSHNWPSQLAIRHAKPHHQGSPIRVRPTLVPNTIDSVLLLNGRENEPATVASNHARTICDAPNGNEILHRMRVAYDVCSADLSHALHLHDALPIAGCTHT